MRHLIDNINPAYVLVYLIFLDELYLALVQSTRAHARIVQVDETAALAMAGVHGYISAGDVPGSNSTGMFGDEKIFTTDLVCSLIL